MLRPCAGAAANLKSTSCVSSPYDVPSSAARSCRSAARTQHHLWSSPPHRVRLPNEKTLSRHFFPSDFRSSDVQSARRLTANSLLSPLHQATDVGETRQAGRLIARDSGDENARGAARGVHPIEEAARRVVWRAPAARAAPQTDRGGDRRRE